MKPPVQYAMMPPRVDAPKVGKMKPVEDQPIGDMKPFNLDEALRYYLGPTGIPDRLAAVNSIFNQVESLGGSMQASQEMLAPDTPMWDRVGAFGRMLSGVAGTVVPMVGAAKVGAPLANGVVDAFTGISTAPATQAAKTMATDFAVKDAGGVNLNGLDWYHGTPDGRELRQAGGFQPRTMTVMDQTITKPVFLSDKRKIAASYADPKRAWDYQNAVPEVFSAKATPQKVVDIDAGGEDFRGLAITAVRKGLIDAGASADEVDARLAKALKRSDGKIRTDDVSAIVHGLGFDAADILNVRDAYNNNEKAVKSTVRMMFNPEQIAVDGLPPVAPMRPVTPAQDVARLLSEGRASDVTEEMRAAADPQEMWNLYKTGATGMDMPVDHASRMARAKDMGFDEPGLHGTYAEEDYSTFGRPRASLRRESYFAPANKPDFASSFAAGDEGGRVLPVMLRSGDFLDGRGGAGNEKLMEILWDNNLDTDFRLHRTDGETKRLPDWGEQNVIDAVNRSGATGLRLQERPGMTSAAVFDPTAIRSRFAMFDPRLKHLANLSAAGVGAAYLAPDERRGIKMGQ